PSKEPSCSNTNAFGLVGNRCHHHRLIRVRLAEVEVINGFRRINGSEGVGIVGHDDDPSMRAIVRAASVCESLNKKAAREMTSPPLSPAAKSAHMPARGPQMTILKEPRCRSKRVGFSARYSLPTRRPFGSQRFRRIGSSGNVA